MFTLNISYYMVFHHLILNHFFHTNVPLLLVRSSSFIFPSYSHDSSDTIQF